MEDYMMQVLETSKKLERKQRAIALRNLKLQMREAVIKNKRRKIAKSIKKITINSLIREKRTEKLVGEHKREMEGLQKKISFLEKQVNLKQVLEDLHKTLNEKEEELVDLKTFTQVMSVKVQSNNHELQDTYRTLIKGLKKLPQDAHIGVKRIGELPYKPFYDATKQIYDETIAENRASNLCSVWDEYLVDQRALDTYSLWEEHIRDINLHPFIVIIINGLSQEVVDEADIKLKRLKTEMGDEVYKVVTSALMDINKYNPDKRCIKEELWNFTEFRKATLKEGVCCLLKMCDRDQDT